MLQVAGSVFQLLFISGGSSPMTQLTLDSVVLVPVVCIRLSLHPLLPCRVVFDFGLSVVEHARAVSGVCSQYVFG